LQSSQPNRRKAFASALDGRLTGLNRFGNRLIVESVSGFKQNAGASKFAGRVLAAAEHLQQGGAFVFSQSHKVFFGGHS
jgi:hypothetical protein